MEQLTLRLSFKRAITEPSSLRKYLAFDSSMAELNFSDFKDVPVSLKRS